MTTEPAPAVRVIHHLARSGGTLICKCLGSMHGVVLLSEVHPLSHRAGPVYDPLVQAHRWHGLIRPEDRAAIDAAGRPPFADTIALIDQRCRERGQTLLVRDWNHLDFTGVPYMPPTWRLSTLEALRDRFEVRSIATVRHPIDQFLSLRLVPIVRGRLALAPFLAGCRAFAERAVEIGFHRYEDFVRDPDAVLRALCERLELPFDPGYRERWPSYQQITGDVRGTRGGGQITAVPRRPVEPAVLEQFAANADYQRTLELLGYGHPE